MRAMRPQESMELPLFPKKRQYRTGVQEKVRDSSNDPAHPERWIENVRVPTLTVSWPSSRPDGELPCVLVCPGGGYAGLTIDKEGHALARWLNANGFVAGVLKYRLPEMDKQRPGIPWPLQDVQRAMRMLRYYSEEWGIDPRKTGVMGSSAGGHLASSLAIHFGNSSLRARDAIDGKDCRPDFQILLYPVITMMDKPWVHLDSMKALLGKRPRLVRRNFHSSEKQVSKQAPPAFLVHAIDDKVVKWQNSLLYHDALKGKGVPCALVLFDEGGHGFGLGIRGGEVTAWPGKCLTWLEDNGFR